jgi:hypothetical protein
MPSAAANIPTPMKAVQTRIAHVALRVGISMALLDVVEIASELGRILARHARPHIGATP